MKKRLAEALVLHFSYFPFKKWPTGSVRDIKGAEEGPGSLYSLFHLHKSLPYLTPGDWLALSFKCPSALCGFPRTAVKWSLLLRIINSICCESLAVCSGGRPAWWWPGATRKGRVPATGVPTSSSFCSNPLPSLTDDTVSLSPLALLCTRRRAERFVRVYWNSTFCSSHGCILRCYDDKKENKMKNSYSYEAGGPMRRELY